VKAFELNTFSSSVVRIIIKQSHYRPEKPHRVPGIYGPPRFLDIGT
jgi:hypothetical protein